jgi:protein-S-isoprenylcysteine O-methyltransferase Ste14
MASLFFARAFKISATIPFSKEALMSGTPWYKGQRGEWYVVAQVLFFALVAFGPRHLPGLPQLPDSLTLPLQIAGAGLGLFGLGLMAAAFFNLGPSLTPLPKPKDDCQLCTQGAYGLVRHPIYSAGIFMALGWALFIQGGLTLVYALLLLAFFDIKARREEAWLAEKFPQYPAYQEKVRKLIPGLY